MTCIGFKYFNEKTYQPILQNFLNARSKEMIVIFEMSGYYDFNV